MNPIRFDSAFQALTGNAPPAALAPLGATTPSAVGGPLLVNSESGERESVRALRVATTVFAISRSWT